MADVNVKGHGTFRFPDGMSEAEMAAAIDKHISSRPKEPTLGGNQARGVSGNFVPPAMGTFFRNLGKGLPIAGNYIDSTPELEDYRRDNPELADAQRLAGTSLAFAPLGAAGVVPQAARIGSVPIGRAMSPIGNKLGQQMATQGTIGAGLSAGDLATSDKDYDQSDLAWEAGKGGLLGAAGPYAAKFISPVSPELKGIRSEVRDLRQRAQDAGDLVDDLAPNPLVEQLRRQAQNADEMISTENVKALPFPAQQIVDATSNLSDINPILRAIGGGVGASYIGQHPLIGAAASYAIPAIGRGASNVIRNAPDASPFFNRLFENQMMSDPLNKAILNALLHGTSTMNENTPRLR